MASSDKIFRDPLYNYIAIDRDRDCWLLELIDTVEIQRLRRIHQLGVSHFTYPGADHNRLSHTLGVLHLMQQAWRRIEALGPQGPSIDIARMSLLAAAVLHDVGHGPFSHLFEPALGIDHEYWSCQIILNEETEVHQKLVEHEIPIKNVVQLIEKNNRQRPVWQKTLLSSELDVDRLDYLRRDSYFTGAGCGHYDWYRILNTFALHETSDGIQILVWPDKAKYAIEEYIFSRFYMYNNVYQHHTTRGFEKLIHAAWKRADQIRQDGDAYLVHEIEAFLSAESPSVKQYLALEDATLVYQFQVWTRHPDRVLSDLAKRLLSRQGLVAIEDPITDTTFDDAREKWENALRTLVAQKSYESPELYALRDDLKLTIYNPYMPEKEEEEQDPYNAIFIESSEGGEPQEISKLLERLKPVTGAREKQFRYYVPRELRNDVLSLAKSRSW